MSHFEYISVAVALIYALVAGRLLTGLTPSLDESRRYPWIFGLVPWFTPAPVQPTAGVLLVTLSLAGIVFKSESAHAVIVILTLLMAISAFYLIPGAPPVL